MPSRDLLEIPEVMDNVASHLGAPDFTSCDLTIQGPFGADKMHIYPSLRNLQIRFREKKSFDPRGIIDWDLTEKSPLLGYLLLAQVDVERLFCKTLSEHSNITSLDLEDVMIKVEVVSTFWEACRNLESLNMNNVFFEGESVPVPKNVIFHRLHRLNTHGGGWTSWMTLDLISHCPKLESFKLVGHAFVVHVLISHPVRMDRWPEAHTLLSVRHPQDTELGSILEGIGNCCGNITYFSPSRFSFRSQAFKKLSIHFGTLVTLYLHRSLPITGANIMDILCSCLKLEVLKVRSISSRDIAKGGPWICQQLRELDICFHVGETEQHLQRLVFERLSTLVRLTSLDVSGLVKDGGSDGLLEFRLECGLRQLQSLQELRTLQFGYRSFTGQTQRLGIDDIEWMVGNWKKLECIAGDLSPDREVDERLKGILKSHGINTYKVSIIAHSEHPELELKKWDLLYPSDMWIGLVEIKCCRIRVSHRFVGCHYRERHPCLSTNNSTLMSKPNDILLPGIAIANTPPQESKQTMPSKNPLEIPEIMNMVAPYLDNGALVCCLRVSKGWRDIFLPYRWRVICRTFLGSRDSFKYYGPDEEALHKYRHLVQDLTMEEYFKADAMYNYPNLRNLQIHFYNIVEFIPSRTIDWDLTKGSPLLTHLSLNNAKAELIFCEALSKHPNITSLRLEDVVIKADVEPKFWEACKNLESLKLIAVMFEEFVPLPENMVLDRLTKLYTELAWTHLQELDMISHCPNLKSYELFGGSIRTRVLINHPIRIDRWPQVDDQMRISNPQDNELASILEGIWSCRLNIIYFYLNRGSFGQQAFKALSFHHSTLVEVDLEISSSLASTGILDVLCSCPMLEVMRAKNISIRDIAGGQPWVCQQLRELKIRFGAEGAGQDLQRLAFERLSTLPRLWRLDMSVLGDYDDEVLQFQLDCGLGQLETLKELTILKFEFGLRRKERQQLGREDIEWMMSNWKKLKHLTGYLHRDRAINRQLKDVVESHTINTFETFC
ncbi:MAG: hypothetical protein J3Q66DRAFT_445832 [Benniella sp.]|nr:MAG: hypothetical protein J3Q66DRAFT_445832 [Benniella sp.]